MEEIIPLEKMTSDLITYIISKEVDISLIKDIIPNYSETIFLVGTGNNVLPLKNISSIDNYLIPDFLKAKHKFNDQYVALLKLLDNYHDMNKMINLHYAINRIKDFSNFKIMLEKIDAYNRIEKFIDENFYNENLTILITQLGDILEQSYPLFGLDLANKTIDIYDKILDIIKKNNYRITDRQSKQIQDIGDKIKGQIPQMISEYNPLEYSEFFRKEFNTYYFDKGYDTKVYNTDTNFEEDKTNKILMIYLEPRIFNYQNLDSFINYSLVRDFEHYNKNKVDVIFFPCLSADQPDLQTIKAYLPENKKSFAEYCMSDNLRNSFIEIFQKIINNGKILTFINYMVFFNPVISLTLPEWLYKTFISLDQQANGRLTFITLYMNDKIYLFKNFNPDFLKIYEVKLRGDIEILQRNSKEFNSINDVKVEDVYGIKTMKGGKIKIPNFDLTLSRGKNNFYKKLYLKYKKRYLDLKLLL